MNGALGARSLSSSNSGVLRMTAASGKYPLVIPFATTMMSGTTPHCSTPKSDPSRPKPVMTSSAMHSTPWRWQTSYIRGR